MNTMPSIIANDEEVKLKTNKADIAALLVKGTVGVIPLWGPMIAETLTAIIPNQKMDRVISFLSILEYKLKDIEGDVLKQKMQTEEFTDLLEDGFVQASRALSEERKQYIASMLKNGLSSEELDHLEKKTLLQILGQLNDAELIILKAESLPHDKIADFWKTHESSLDYNRPTFGCGQEVVDKAAVRNTFRQHLVQLGLLGPRYSKPKKGEMPEFDDRTGALKASSYSVTSLGDLLLRYVDLTSDPNKP